MQPSDISPFTTTRRVQFHDTDVAGIMHFSAFFLYMEEAEHEFLRSIGLGTFMEVEGETLSWPRVSASCDFRSPARFEEVMTIAVNVEELKPRAVTYSFEFDIESRQLALGKMTSVCCRMTTEGPKSIEMPTWIAERLEKGRL